MADLSGRQTSGRRDARALQPGGPPRDPYQRATVIVSDLVLILAAYRISRSHPGKGFGPLTFLLVVANAGLLLVDHIHLQYSGFVLGILLWSIHCAQQQRDPAAALLFAALLNTDQDLACAAPAFAVYLLRHYCGGGRCGWAGPLGRFLALACVTVGVFGLSLGPFAALGQPGRVLKRLLASEGLGLTHPAHWAGNFWSLCGAAGKALLVLLPRLGWKVTVSAPSCMASSASQLSALPQVAPLHSSLLVLLALLPCLASLARRPPPQRLAAAVAYSCLSSFMFGLQVQGQAILLVLIPLAVWAGSPHSIGAHRGDFIMLSAAGLYGLLPLIHAPQHYLIKNLLAGGYVLVAWGALQQQVGGAGASGGGGGILSPSACLHLAGFVPLELACALLHGLVLGPLLPLLPTMLPSVYCSIGIASVWLRMALSYARGDFKHGGY